MSIKNKPESRVTLEDLISASSRVGAVIESVRGTMLAPLLSVPIRWQLFVALRRHKWIIE